MNRPATLHTPGQTCVPCARRDEPLAPPASHAPKSVFPAPAGMNRGGELCVQHQFSVPCARSDGHPSQTMGVLDCCGLEDDNESWQAWLSWLGAVAGHHGSIAEDADRYKSEFVL